jgi:hypothetical protein
MQDHEDPFPSTSKRTAWNTSKLIGAKPPLRPKHVRSIRTKLQVEAHAVRSARYTIRSLLSIPNIAPPQLLPTYSN